MTSVDPVVELIGRKSFEWLSREFTRSTTLRDLPDDILSAVASTDITVRDYASDPNAVTAIAVLTFAYRMADRVQEPHHGPGDILLLKVLARGERARREGSPGSRNRFRDLPLFELITGEVGERIRGMSLMGTPG
ncbi:MAG: hypothetical protein DRH56_06570 [Deltaproteobacteria bacterium]|nr:MAG: hypothetical protein DRH56_06570 [Deltaproteobacteria bacterium]